MTTAQITGYSVPRLLAEATSDLSETYELVYVDRGDGLEDEAVNELLSGDMEAFYERFWEWESDSQYSGAEYIEGDVVNTVLGRWARADDEFDPDVIRDLWQGSEAQETLRESIRERDNSDWVADLARNTSAVLCRIRATDEDFDVSFGADEPQTAEDLCKLVKLPADERNLKAAQSIIDNAQTYGVLYYLVAVDVLDIARAPEGASIVFSDPHVLLSNPYAGDGHEEQLFGKVTVPIKDVKTDEGQFGYSWNNIAGVYTSAYREDYEVIVQVREVAVE